MYSRNNFAGSPEQQKNAIKRLWSEAALWTRTLIISVVYHLEDIAALEQRLQRIPADFAWVLLGYFGSEQTDKFKSLLSEHFLLAEKLIKAVNESDADGADLFRRTWYRNAGDISLFLAETGFLIENDWRILLFGYLLRTEKETALRTSGLYSSDILLYDEIEKQADTIAESMADGILYSSINAVSSRFSFATGNPTTLK